MNNQNQFLLQIFEKIGAPLFTSVNEVSARMIMTGQATQSPSETQQAETIAKLLTSVTKASGTLIEKLELENSDPDTDDLHIATAAMLSPVIANTYQLNTQPPKEDDLEKIISSFETIATFANNFSSTKEGTERLENLSGTNASPQDESQKTLQKIMSTVPLINAVIAFPFGESADKLLKKIYTTLDSHAQTLSKELSLENDATIFPALVTMYNQCHFTEMARIMAMTDKDRETAKITIDTVWEKFNQQLAMLTTLSHAVAEPSTTDAETASPPQQTQENNPPVQQPAETPVQTPPPAGGENANPMSFFATKKSEDSAE